MKPSAMRPSLMWASERVDGALPLAPAARGRRCRRRRRCGHSAPPARRRSGCRCGPSVRAMPRLTNCSMAARWASARRAARGSSATRIAGQGEHGEQARKTQRPAARDALQRQRRERHQEPRQRQRGNGCQQDRQGGSVAPRSLRQHADDLARRPCLGGADGGRDARAVLLAEMAITSSPRRRRRRTSRRRRKSRRRRSPSAAAEPPRARAEQAAHQRW